jgi:hypothetical protein
VQIIYSRNNSGYVKYTSVPVDGAQSNIDATASSAFALGRSPTLPTNFRANNCTAGSVSSTVYLDDLTICRWRGWW